MARSAGATVEPEQAAAGPHRVALALVGGGLALLAAAFFNGAPLLYPDSMDYLLHGSQAAQALVSGASPDWWSTRSFLYALAILPLHAHVSAWPVIAFHALVTAWLVWLTLRTTLSRPSPKRFLAVIALLTPLTSVSWFVSYAMPDVFAALLMLGTYLLCFRWDALRRGERIGVVALVWLAIVSHSSHLALACGLIPVVLAVGWAVHRPMRDALFPAARLAAVAVVAVAATLLVNAALLGEASLSGRRPPFLLARVLADGTAQPYLEAGCDRLDLAVCARAQNLPDNVRDVLWAEGSLWGSASPAQRQRMRDEELAVVLGAIRTDPVAQAAASARNFWSQLESFGMWGSFAPDPYIEARIQQALPRFADAYPRTRQARKALHERFFGRLHRASLLASLGVLVGFAWCQRHRAPARLAALCAIVGFGVLGNAAITGVLSNVEERYQARVVWLVPLLALIAGVEWIESPRRATPESGARA